MSTLNSLFFPPQAAHLCQFWTLHLVSTSYWVHPYYLCSVLTITGHWNLIVNFFQELELGSEGFFEVWADFEKFRSRSATILLAWRLNQYWLTVLWSEDTAYRVPYYPHTFSLGPQTQANEIHQLQLASGSWIAGESGNGSTINHLKLPQNLGISQ